LDDFNQESNKLKEEDKNNISINNNIRIEELLKKISEDVVFDEKYQDLIELGIENDSLGNLIFEQDDFTDFSDTFERTQYLTSELYPIKGSEVKISDIFVCKPNQNKKPKSEGAGYILTKFKNEECVYIQEQFFNYNIDRSMSYLTIANYIENIKYITSILNERINKKYFFQIDRIMLFLYKLLCKTFILTKSGNLDTKTFKVKDKKIIFCLQIENKYSDNQLRKLYDKGIVLDYQKVNNLDYILVKCNDRIFF